MLPVALSWYLRVSTGGHSLSPVFTVSTSPERCLQRFLLLPPDSLPSLVGLLRKKTNGSIATAGKPVMKKADTQVVSIIFPCICSNMNLDDVLDQWCCMFNCVVVLSNDSIIAGHVLRRHRDRRGREEAPAAGIINNC